MHLHKWQVTRSQCHGPVFKTGAWDTWQHCSLLWHVTWLCYTYMIFVLNTFVSINSVVNIFFHKITTVIIILEKRSSGRVITKIFKYNWILKYLSNPWLSLPLMDIHPPFTLSLPQRWVLAPKIFLLNISDLFSSMSNYILSYANDSTSNWSFNLNLVHNFRTMCQYMSQDFIMIMASDNHCAVQCILDSKLYSML